eukprot:m.227286 g.227286  ORF g.227286 m.227286 type:complete len:133 (+) comp17320_c0_seq9:60-458(+)
MSVSRKQKRNGSRAVATAKQPTMVEMQKQLEANSQMMQSMQAKMDQLRSDSTALKDELQTTKQELVVLQASAASAASEPVCKRAKKSKDKHTKRSTGKTVASCGERVFATMYPNGLVPASTNQTETLDMVKQ